MTWQIKYLPEAEDDLAALNQSVRPQILKGIRKVAQNPGYPDGYGKPLGNFAASNLARCFLLVFTAGLPRPDAEKAQHVHAVDLVRT
nr:MAG TPA: hypothetical protein [Caudoviricetes sp.]